MEIKKNNPGIFFKIDHQLKVSHRLIDYG